MACGACYNAYLLTLALYLVTVAKSVFGKYAYRVCVDGDDGKSDIRYGGARITKAASFMPGMEQAKACPRMLDHEQDTGISCTP
jgi:hypothetical protein